MSMSKSEMIPTQENTLDNTAYMDFVIQQIKSYVDYRTKLVKSKNPADLVKIDKKATPEEKAQAEIAVKQEEAYQAGYLKALEDFDIFKNSFGTI